MWFKVSISFIVLLLIVFVVKMHIKNNRLQEAIIEQEIIIEDLLSHNKRLTNNQSKFSRYLESHMDITLYLANKYYLLTSLKANIKDAQKACLGTHRKPKGNKNVITTR